MTTSTATTTTTTTAGSTTMNTTTTYTIEMKQDGKWIALRYTYDTEAEAQAEIDYQVAQGHSTLPRRIVPTSAA